MSMMTQNCYGEPYGQPCATALPAQRPSLRALLSCWMARREERLQLAALSSELLDDIGITRADARREAAKPFWRA